MELKLIKRYFFSLFVWEITNCANFCASPQNYVPGMGISFLVARHHGFGANESAGALGQGIS
jgi:hypothetical protein